MKGMEIFNNDDFSDDFLEINESSQEVEQLDAGNIIQTPKPKAKEPTENQDEDSEQEEDQEAEDTDLNELEVLLPSNKSEQNKDTDSNSSTLSPKFFSSLVQALKEGGILDDVEQKDIKSQEDFLSVIEESVKAREFADLTETQKAYLEALRSGIPHEDIDAHLRNIEGYSSITEDAISEESIDGESLRRTVIMNNFMAKGITENKAKKLTDKMFDSGEDVEEAIEALNELKQAESQQFEQTKQNRIAQKQQAEKAEKEAIDKLNKIAKDTKELIPGLQITQSMKTAVLKGLTQPVGYTEDNRPLDIISKYLYENPIEGRFKLAYLLSVTDGMKKMNVLESKKARSNAFKDLQNALSYNESGGALSFDGRGDDEGNEGFSLDNYKFI